MDEFLDGTWGQGLLLEYVFLEVVTVLMARRGLPVASATATLLLSARELDLVPCSGIFLETLETFRSQERTRLSFTDAAILTVARQQTDGLVATFDEDFRKLEGINVVPR
jgi:predicted nucleic acid-binding protein